MNNSIFILKLIEEPSQNFYKNQVKLVELKAIFPYFRQQTRFDKINLLVWGNLGDDLAKYYRKGDYIIAEGYITTASKLNTLNLEKKERKTVEFTVLKIYPIF